MHLMEDDITLAWANSSHGDSLDDRPIYAELTVASAPVSYRDC